MPLKGSGPATTLREIDRWESGVGWIAYPEEDMQRASHALAVDGEVWLVDPVDAEGLDDLVGEFGEVAGVVLLLDRHKRDAAEIAQRYDVAVHVPVGMDDAARAIEKRGASVEVIRDELADTGYELHRIISNPFWHEVALWHEDSGTLVVPEAIGTAPHNLAEGERLGVNPALRLTPPSKLREFEPERVLVGHGEGVLEDAAAALADALDNARRRAPGVFVKIAKGFIAG